MKGVRWTSAAAMMPTLQSITAKTFGVVFLLIGILGFFENPLVSRDGFFQVNAVHNWVHLASGAVALAMGFAGERVAWMYNLSFGAVYALVTLFGFFGAEWLVSLLALNLADHVLHLVIALTLLGVAAAAPDTVRHGQATTT